ncbi:hypothetical protein [Rhodococcus sp. BE178]|uniref:hypothetical protein n=1 Tax=Rhodococcus sp. BE178 TaxID=2817737 RepID=UPI003D1D0DA4
MSQRDELANLVYTHGLNGTPNSVADAILAAGYIKADSEEWGVQRAPRFGGTVSAMHTRGEAESCVRQWPGSTLVRRSVGHGPWEVA